MSQRIDENAFTTGVNFYAGKGSTMGSDYIYDETYKSYKIKQKFEKDPKYSYFNAVMQMKHKLSTKEQVYKNVFEAKQNQEQTSKDFEGRRTLYSKANQSMFDSGPEIVKVEKLKRNSFKIVKEQPALDSLAIMKKNQSHTEVTSMNRTSVVPWRSGHRSSMSLTQKHNTTQMSFEMTTKARNNKSYVEFQVTQRPTEINPNQTFYQSSNPKPRLEEIMQEYRKMNRHSHYTKSKKSTLPKQFVEKLYQTNKMFYSHNGKKRASLY